jgi:hypothetical protein
VVIVIAIVGRARVGDRGAVVTASSWMASSFEPSPTKRTRPREVILLRTNDRSRDRRTLVLPRLREDPHGCSARFDANQTPRTTHHHMVGPTADLIPWQGGRFLGAIAAYASATFRRMPSTRRMPLTKSAGEKLPAGQ